MTHPQDKAFSCVCVYVFLVQDGELLWLLRQNTGYLDGHYGLVSGHVEKGESAKEGMVREAYEEVGILIDPDDLKVLHVMHRQTSRINIDIFFECTRWKGELTNKEPHKHEQMEFFPFNDPPPNIKPYLREVLSAINEGRVYSEVGFHKVALP